MFASNAAIGPAEAMLAGFDVDLQSFAVCEIGRGWRLACPEMDSVLVHYVLRGEGFLECHDRTAPLGPNMIIVAPRRTLKHLRGPGPAVRDVDARDTCAVLTDGLLRFRACDETPDLVLACGIVAAGAPGAPGPFDQLTEPLIVQPAGTALSQAFAAILDELSSPGVGAHLLAEALMKQCLLLLLRSEMREHGALSPLFQALGDPRLARAIAGVLQRPGAPHGVESLARAAGMSRAAFVALFTAQYGSTPGSFVHTVRLRTAARMLRMSHLSVKTIAPAVGYASRSQFSRAFKSVYGADPTAYRNARAPSSAPDREPAPAPPAPQPPRGSAAGPGFRILAPMGAENAG